MIRDGPERRHGGRGGGGGNSRCANDGSSGS